MTLSKTALTVTEEDTTGDSYTVVLDTLPTANVVVTAAGHAGTGVTLDTTTLTFTTVNWETAQEVTVTASDDADTAGETVTLTHSAASTDSDYDGIAIADVTVTVEDDDTVQVTGVTVDSGNAQLVVGWDAVGNATGYRVQWKSGGQSYNASRQAIVASGSITSHTIPGLTNGTEYTLRVKAVRTGANDGPWSADATGMPAVPAAPGVTLSKTSLTVTEEDTTGDSYTVVLDTLPTASVVVTVAGHAGTDVTPDMTTLTFTTANWETAQPVNVTADNDADITEDMVTLTHSAASTDSDYDGIAIADVTVTVEDDDTAQVTGVTVAPGNAQLVVGWDAVGNATGYRVQWKSGGQSYNTSRQAMIASGSITSHTIPGLTNGTEYTMRVRAVRTGANDGPWSDDATGMPAVPTAPGVTLSVSSLTVTEEDTAGDSYTVVLDTLPTASVTVTVAGHSGTAVTVTATSTAGMTATSTPLTFTTVNWSTAQAVTVTAADDADTADDMVTLTHSAASTDSDYGGIAIAGVTVMVEDNDTAQVTGVTVAPGNAQLAVGWDAVGNATGYEVQWKSGSQGHNTSRQATIASGTTTSHTISSLTNGTEYTMRVRAVRTGANDGPWSDNATGTPAVLTAPGVTLSKTALTVTEEDATGDSYTVVLDTLPTASVVVTVAGHAGTDVTATSTTLTFTTGNWSTAQAVTVTAAGDMDTTNDMVTLTHSAASTDSDYGGIAIADVTVTVADDDSANRAPVFDDGARTRRTLSETLGGTPPTSGQPVGQPVAASDADNDSLEYSLEGADAGRFTVAPGTGQIRTLANTVYDYEMRQSYAVVVNVEDGNGGSDTIEVTLAVEDQVELPRQVSQPTVTTQGTTSLRVIWTAPENAGRPTITGYDVRHVTSGVSATQRVTGTSVTLTGLEPDTRYFVDVRAVNADGPSQNWSIPRSGNTAPVLVTFGASSYTATEGGVDATVTVELSEAVGSSTTIPLTPTNRDGATNADYTGVPPNVMFGAAQTSRTFTVTAVDDSDNDRGESVRIGFGPLPPGVAAGSPATATVALEDDDAWQPPTVSFGSSTYKATEGGGAVTVTVEVDRAEVPFTLPLTRDGQGGATSSDYSGVPSSVVFRGSDTAKSFTVTAVDDKVDDDGESVVIGFGAPLPAGLSLRIGSPSEATVELVDDDVPSASGALRLVGGDRSYGRLQVYHDDRWGLVCEGNFGREEAQVACRQLGFADGEEGFGGAGSGGLPFWLKGLDCDGTESRLVECLHRGLREHSCGSFDIAGVECSETLLSVTDARVSGALLTLVYDAALDAGSVPSGGDFVVLAGASGGASAVAVESVAVAGDAVVLTLARPVLADETVRLSYLVAPMHPVQNARGTAAAPLTDRTVRNTTPTAAPDRVAVPDVVVSLGEAPLPAPDLALLPAPPRPALDLSPLLADAGASAPLGRLDLSSRTVADLSALAALAGLTELRVLRLDDNRVVDVGPLAALTGLRVLDLSSNAIADVGPLAALTGLERLDLSDNRIADLSALSALTGLEVLLLDGNRVADVVPLWSLQRLVHLGLSGNRVADIGLLAELGALQRLDLGGNLVADISPLGDLSGLIWLRLPGNPVADAVPLGRLTHLRWLWLDDPVAGLKALMDTRVLLIEPDSTNGRFDARRDPPPH